MDNLRLQSPSHRQNLRRLFDLINDLEDEDIQEIMREILLLESKHRSMGGKYFPVQKVRDVVDHVARKQEARPDNH